MASSFDSTLAGLGINRTGSKTPTVQSASKLDTLTSSDFIKLLTAQLQNQDPTSPVDATQQLTQLAQFSQVSGISEINTTLKAIQDQLTKSGSTSTADALAYVGHNVLVPGDTAYPRTSGGLAGAIELGDAASKVQVTIESQDGQVLKVQQLGAQPKGTVNFDWDGKTASGGDAGSGPFKILVNAVSDGKAVTAQSLVWAPVNSVSLPSTGGPVLSLPGLDPVAASDVREVG